MAEITVDVGVRLKAMQSSVADLQKVLDGLQPNSSGFKALQKIIADINRDMDRLRIQTSKPFGSQNQFNQTEKTVDKLEESLEKVKITIDRIKFSDLKLDSSQTAQLDNFKQQLKDIKQEFTDFKADLKGQFLDNDFNKAFVEGINPNLINKNFDEIVKNVNSKVDSLGSALARAKADLEEFQNASKIGEKVDKIPDEGLISQAGLGENFKKFFQINSKGIFGFKTGGGLQKGEIKQQFIKYLTEEFQLTEGQIKQLQDQTTAKAIRDLLSNKDFFNSQLNAATTANKKMSGAESTFTTASKNYENAAAVVARLTPLLSALSDEELSLEDKQKLVNQAIREFEQECVNGAKGSKTMDTALTGLDSQLNSFKTQLGQVNVQWLNLQKQQATFNSMKSAIVNFMGFNQVLNLTKKAVKEAMDHIKQLDTVMNGIAIVTDMTTADLWNQVDVYSEMAQRYGTSIQGAYEVSKIYYQAGYETNEVLTLMNETLKMSKISGLDYATTTDYMMNAIKGFKMEVADAASVVDVYSALAANTAVSQQELAEAMSKTASSMAGVGSTFEDTSAMIATMVSVTRESANNIGSAMKSIASRYGELTKDPTKLLDSEGEAMSFNKVDTALKSVGITLQTTDHQFRDFTDVIVELANKWDTLDSAQQRYIATQFAGNRQQNRFLALVSNKDLLQENMDVAAASEDTGTLQALKALDSLESKLNQVQVAYQQFYTTIGAEEVWKTVLDGVKSFIDSLNGLPKVFDKIPLGAVAVLGNLIGLVKTALLNGLTTIAQEWNNIMNNTNNNAADMAQNGGDKIGKTWIGALFSAIKEGQPKIEAAMLETVGNESQKAQQEVKYTGTKINTEDFLFKDYYNKNFDPNDTKVAADTYLQTLVNMEQAGTQFSQSTLYQLLDVGAAIENGSISLQEAGQRAVQIIQDTGSAAETNTSKVSNFWQELGKSGSNWQKGLTGLAQSLTTIGMLLDKTSKSGRIMSGVMTGLGGAVQTGVAAARVMAQDWSALPQLIMGIFNVINGIGIGWETDAERLERLTKEAEELNNEAKKTKAEYNTLQRSVDKLEELKEKRYESAEAAEEYQSAVDDLASKFPEMIAGFDEAGNIILDTTDAERILAEAREKSKQATYDAAKAEMDEAQAKLDEAKSELQVSNIQQISTASSNNKGSDRVSFFDDKFSIREGLAYSGITSLSESGFVANFYEWYTTNATEEEKKLYSNLQSFIEKVDETTSIGDFIAEVLAGWQDKTDLSDAEQQFLYLIQQDEEKSNKELNEINTLITQLNEVGINSDEGIELYKELSSKVTNYAQKYNIDDLEGWDSLIAFLDSNSEAMGEIFSLSDIYKGNERIVISAWQEANDNNGKAWEYLEESSGLAAIVTKQIQSDIGDTDYTTAEAEQASKWKEYQAAAEQFYSNLSESEQKIFNQMIEDTANYSGIDIAKYFNITEGTDLYNAIINYYSDGVKSIQDRLKNNLTAHHDVDFSSLKETDTDFISNYAKLISDENNEFTKNEESFLNSILSQFDFLNKQGFVKRAEVIGLAGINLFEEIQTLPEDIQKSLINSILENGLTTKEGIQKTLDSFKNNKTVTDTQVDEILTDIGSQIINNVALSIQTATSNLLENWDDTSKELTKALSGGLEFKEAEALITKAESLDVSLDLDTDFVQNGDKLILTSKKFNEYWEKLDEQSKNKAEQWQEDIDKASLLLGKITNGFDRYNFSENDKAIIEAISPDFFNQEEYFTNGYLNNTGMQALAEAYENSLEGLERYNTYAQMAAEELKRTQDWIEGNYKETEELKDIDLKELASGNIELGREEYNLRAARENINSAYNSLISDVLSKGFENINLEDYSGLVSENKAAIKKAIKTGNYEQFIKDYAAWAGRSIEETNALIVQAIEKDTQATTGAAAEAVGKIQWLSDKKGFASLGDIQNLADALGISVDKILGEYNNQLDMYLVDLSDAEGIDLSAIDGFSDTVKDSINAFLKQIFENVNKAITGKLTNADVTTLTGQLEQLGLKDITLDFTQTVDGLKLSQHSAIELYNELKKIDALQAQLVFDELAKSLEASDTNYTNISTTLARIAELEKAIKEMKPDDARLQMYKNELAVAQEIARTRSSTDNKDFNFMDRALPTGMQNPIDYWNATGEAYKVMNASVKSGYMEIQDFYNIVQEMSNMAQVSGQTLHFMGQEIDGSAENAAALIEKGFSALTNIKGDGVKIALGNIGAEFETGAEAMKGDFDSGIKSMAKAQIQMLDAAINMLEAIVAMENIDIDSNGILDFGEIFTGTEGNVTGFTENTEQWLKQLDTLTGGIEIGGIDLKTALFNMASEGEEGAQRAVELLNKLYSIDWTLGDMNVFDQIQGVLQAFYPGVEITQGKSIFEALEIPKNADKQSDNFNKWIEKTGLAAKQAERLIDYLSVGGEITYKNGERKTGYVEAIEKLLNLEKQGQKETLEKFAGEDNKLTQEEITLFSELDISWEEDGELKEAVYTASDGSQLVLSGDASNWQTDIKNYEDNILINKHIGNNNINTSNSAHTTLTTVTLSSGVTVDAAIQANKNNITAYYQGQSATFDNMEEAKAWIKEQAELSLYHIGETGGTTTRINTETNEVEIIPVYKITGEKTSETEQSVEKLLSMTGAEAQKYVNNLPRSKEGKIVIPDIPIEFEEGTDASYIQQVVDQYFGNGTFDTLPGKIAEGITTAFTQDTSIGEAIGTGITTALTKGVSTDGKEKDIPIPSLSLKPDNVTITLGETSPTVEGIDQTGIPIPSITINAEKAILTSSNYDETSLNPPEPIDKGGILKVAYDQLKLLNPEEAPDESDIYTPMYLTEHPEMTAILSLLILKSVSGITDYNEDNVSDPDNELDKSLSAAANLAKITLNSNADTEFLEGTITIGNGKELKISSVLTAIANGGISIKSPEGGASVIKDPSFSIAVGDEEIDLSSTEFSAIIDSISAKLANGAQLDYSEITNNIPSEVELGTITGKVKVNVNFEEKNIAEQLKDIYKTKNNPGAISIGFGELDSTQLNNYITAIETVVNDGQTLSSLDFSNLQFLNTYKENENLGFDDATIDKISELTTKASEINSETSETVSSISENVDAISNASDVTSSALDGLSSLTTLTAGELPNIATILSEIVNSATSLESIDFNGISQGLSALLGVTAPESSVFNQNNAQQQQQISQLSNMLKGALQDINAETLNVETTTSAIESTSTEFKTSTVNVEASAVNVNSNKKTDGPETNPVTSPVSGVQVEEPSTLDLTGSTFEIPSATITAENSTINGTFNVENSGSNNSSSNSSSNEAENFTVDTTSISQAVETLNSINSEGINNIKQIASEIDDSKISSVKSNINEINPNNAKTARGAINSISSIGAISAKNAINSITAPNTLESKLKVSLSSAKGNIGGFANSKGNVALAGGQNTLMGELGPELVVSNGRYFLVGQNGAEFVNLAKDAIVFNHLQTRRLMEQGAIGSRGKPLTNERTAVAFAKGKYQDIGPAKVGEEPESKPQKVKSLLLTPNNWNINWFKGTSVGYGGSSKSFVKGSGKAMASASAALAALKQLRSMWQSLLNASLSDLGAMPGGSGGGGGGGGGGDNKFYTGVNFEVEQWYNWLKEIEATQNNINKLTKQYTLLEKQNKGSKALTNNLKEQAKYLQQNVQTRQALVEEQKKERNRQLNSVKNTALSAFYRVDRENNRLALGDDKRYLNYISKYLPENLAQTLYGGKTASLKIVTSEPVKDENGNLTDDRQDVSLDVNIPKSGLALLNELSRQDETTGEMAYSAAQQYEILKRLGFEEFMTIDPQGNRIDTSTDEGKQTAVQNFIDEVNGAKDSVDSLNDSISEQEDSILDDKIAIQEINDQFNEMAKRIQGVTESLELWYNTTRKLSSEQNELNLLVAKFNNLQNLGGKNRTQDLAKNLRQRVEVTEKQKETNAEELKLLNEQRKIESQKIKNSNLITKGIYKKDEYGNLVYNDTDDTFRKQIKEAAKSSKASVKNGEATFSVTNRNIKLDDSGNYIKDLSQYSSAQLKQLGYNTPEERKAAKKTGLTKQDRTNAAKALRKFSGKKNLTTSQKAERDQYKAIINAYDNGLNNLQERQTKVSLDTTDPKKFFEKLTRTDANGNSIFTALQQTEILEQAGFTEELENFGKKQGLFNSWATASEEQRNEATKGYLENLKEIPEVYNEIIQKMKEGEIKSVEYNGDTIEYNNQLKELAHVAAGIQNPFEKWHDWIRKVTEEQNKLNLKTKEYSNLQKDLDNKARTNGLMLGKNLLAQKALLEQEKETNTLYQTARETALRRDYISQLQPKTSKGKKNPKYNEALAQVFTYDKNNGLQFADTTFRQKSNLNIKGITLGKKDKNGAYTYKDTKDFTFSGASTAQELIEKITKQNADKSMKYNVSQQYAILKAYGFDSLMQYDESGEKLIENIENPTKEEIERAVPAFLNYLKNFQEGIDGERDEIQSLAEQGLDIESSLTDIKQAILDNEISLENALEKAIETREQRQIDNLKEQRDAMSKAADNFVNGLKDQLEKERAMYDKQENQDELTKLQRQLAILQRSGGSTSQIRSLQEQIKSQQKDMYFDEREEQIDAVKEASDRQIEKMDQQIELMERALEYSKENGLYWKEVRERMEKSDTSIAKFLEKYSEDFASLSELQKSVARRDNSELARQYTTLRDNANNKFYLSKGISASYSKNAETGKLQKSKTTFGSESSKELIQLNGYIKDKTYGTLLQIMDNNKIRYISLDNFDSSEQELIKAAINEGQLKKIKKFAGGGLINYTGPAWVDGSKSKPESILSAEQTDFLRNDFFKEMSSFSETMNRISQMFSNSNSIVNSIDGQGGITIGQLDFVMKVDSISNDYDAKRAGQMAFDEMVRIARKAGNNSISRR